MNLLLETWHALSWVRLVTQRFLCVAPVRTLALIFSITGKRLSQLLAFFLPLKVILLAGSDGVPRYFQFFIDPDHKTPWIIGLSIGAVGFYLASLLFGYLAGLLAERGSRKIMAAATQFSMLTELMEDMQGYYRKFCRISADSLVVAIGLALIFWLDTKLFVTVTVVVALAYLIPLVVLKFGDLLNPSALVRFFVERTSVYLQTCLAVAFLAGFFAILSRFLGGESDNILVAILSILLLRQSLAGLTNNASLITELWNTRLQIDPVVFPETKVQEEENNVTRKFRSAFSQERRRADLWVALEDSVDPETDITVRYVDCPLPKFYLFEVELRSGTNEETQRMQQQVFAKKSLAGLEHEEFLFQHLSRESLRAPRVITHYPTGLFECQLVDWPRADSGVAKGWQQLLPDLFVFYWSRRPPRSLLRAFESSNMFLHERLTEELLDRTTVAVDTPEQQFVYREFLKRRKEVAEKLSTVPLYIRNPDLSPAFVTPCGDGDWRTMIWHRWKIDYLGTDLPGNLDDDSLAAVIEQVRRNRHLSEGELSIHHLRLANDCEALERSINKDAFNKALTLMRSILENPVIVSG